MPEGPLDREEDAENPPAMVRRTNRIRPLT
jgi:hypothetical protein